ncbi:Ankyrin repeat protein [Penicillium desertorum]|uniref:Ankyrin repeat protein n=1 Tax=Penicillium desertorum TaxID=1303715 RepID=A0A9W9WNW1_9EURO|nr:Ankyrin repeat protein [Penicillium desertorum]
MLRESLKSLPTTLEETYTRILANIDISYQDYTIRILQFLTYSERPLTVQEYIDIIVVDPNSQRLFDLELRMPKPLDITRVYSSLISLVVKKNNWNGKDGERTSTKLQLAYLSVQYRLSEITARGDITKICLVYLSDLNGQTQVSIFVLRGAVLDTSYINGRIRHTQSRQSIWVLKQRREIATPLYYASLAGLQYIIEALLKENIDINTKGGRGHTEIIKLLLKKGANVNTNRGFYGNALQAALSRGHLEIIQLLLKKGTNVNTEGGWYGNALQAALSIGHIETILLLLKNGADVNTQGGRGNANLILLFLKKGADINGLGALGV